MQHCTNADESDCAHAVCVHCTHDRCDNGDYMVSWTARTTSTAPTNNNSSNRISIIECDERVPAKHVQSLHRGGVYYPDENNGLLHSSSSISILDGSDEATTASTGKI
jgi:hypothetical protein